MYILDSSVLINIFEESLVENGKERSSNIKKIENILLNLPENSTCLIPIYIIGETELALRNNVQRRIIADKKNRGELKTENEVQAYVSKYRKDIITFLETICKTFLVMNSDSSLVNNAFRLYSNSYMENSLNDNLLIADCRANNGILFTVDNNLANSAKKDGIKVVPE